MSKDADSYDFFVSYARSDNASGWITRFVEELLAEHKRFSAGRELKPFFDQHAITTGADWQLYLAHGIAHSRLFLAFLSPSYFASEWCRKEWRAWMDAEIAQHILTAGVRPIYIVEVPGLTGKGQLSDQQLAQKLAEISKLPEGDRAKLLAETPPVVKHLRRRQLTHNQPFCDVHTFFDAGLDALRHGDLRQVLDQLARDLDHHAALLSQADASLSTVPAYNKNFAGRLDELLLLRERLIKDDRTGVIYGVHGLGGIGKTELAFTYAQAYASAYPGGRFLIRYEGKSSLRDAVLGQSDFTALFRDISDEDRKQPDTYFAAIVARLRDRLAQLGHVLLVLDNVSDLGLLEPEQTDTLTVLGPKLHLLATTRLVPPVQGKSNWLSLGRLPDDDALDLLEKHRPCASEAERDAARRIVKRLGGFTLTVELVAAWLAKHRGTTCAQFLERPGMASLEGFDFLAEERDVKLRRHNDERRLAAMLDPTLDALAPAERRAMEYAALLPPDHVALPWLRALVSKDFPETMQDDRWLLLLGQLTGLTLFIRPEAETTEPRLLMVHRLVQDRVRSRIPAPVLVVRQKAVDNLVIDRIAALHQTTHWASARWELEPLEALAWIWDEMNHLLADHLCKHTGGFLYDLADWPRAESLLSRALQIVERAYPQNHPEVATALCNLAQLLKANARFAEAEPLMWRAVKINEQGHMADQLDLARDLTHLALLFMNTKRETDAEPLLRKAVGIFKDKGSRPSVEHALAVNGLARFLQRSRCHMEAEPLFQKALTLWEQTVGKTHPHYATTLLNLAVLLKDTRRSQEAEAKMHLALQIDENYYGRDHYTVARDLNEIAALFEFLPRRSAEAEKFFRQAVEIHVNSFRSTGRARPEMQVIIKNYRRYLFNTLNLNDEKACAKLAIVPPEFLH